MQVAKRLISARTASSDQDNMVLFKSVRQILLEILKLNAVYSSID
jgi:hypothetical protein